MADSAANQLNIRVHGFIARPEDEKDANGKKTGKVVVHDYVRYGPPMMADRQVVEARVDRILRAERPNSENPHQVTAWKRAEFIRPLYDAWRRGEELPDNGTPLAALNFLRPEEVEILKRSGVRTAEELAGLLDSNLDAIRLPAMREKRVQAKRFLEAQDTNKSAAKMAALEEQVAVLMSKLNGKSEVDEIDENGDRLPKRRGRPPKAATEQPAIQEDEAA